MLFFPKVYVNNDYRNISSQLSGYLRGQWVCVNGMTGRILNHLGNRVVILLKNGMVAVFP